MSMKLPHLPRSLFPFWHVAQVRHSDSDSNGHVNNAIYAHWLDDGRYTLLHPRLVPGFEIGDFLALVTLQLDFIKEVRYGDAPEIGTLLSGLGTSSIKMEQTIWVGADVVARARSVTVVANRLTGRSKPLSDRQRLVLAGLSPGGAGGELVS